MGLMDSLLGAAQQAMAGNNAQRGEGGGVDWASLVISLLANGSAQGGLAGILQQLQAGGLGAQLQSWISTGANQPVSGAQLGAALGGDTLAQLASQAGVSPAEAGDQLSQLLPQIIDKISPNGQLPTEGLDLGGLLGQLMQGR